MSENKIKAQDLIDKLQAYPEDSLIDRDILDNIIRKSKMIDSANKADFKKSYNCSHSLHLQKLLNYFPSALRLVKNDNKDSIHMNVVPIFEEELNNLFRTIKIYYNPVTELYYRIESEEDQKVYNDLENASDIRDALLINF